MATANGAGPNPPSGKREKELYPTSTWKYDTLLHTMSILADLFFREVHPRSSWKVPRSGPVLFVAGPHANQFVDGLILSRTLQIETKRRVSHLIAQKSVHGFIGWASRQCGSVPVGRAQDSARAAKGVIYLPDPIDDPTLIRGVGTRFDKEAEVDGLLFLPSVKGESGSSENIAQILGPEELRIKRAFKGRTPLRQLTGRVDVDENGKFQDKSVKGCKEGYQGTKFKFAPHIDQSKVYEAVFTRLKNGGCVALFPEGGSHDRTGLLPLKAGVAIMALGTLAEAPDCGLKIVPVGLNYFHAHKFRSRAVIEFGTPFEVPTELVQMYKHDQRRDAIAGVLDMVHTALASVTVSTPDYDTLMIIQAARRLYSLGASGKKLPLPKVVELNRRLAVGYEKYKDEERLQSLKEKVKNYNKQLRYLNLRDHQVQYAKYKWWQVAIQLIYRVIKLVVLFVLTLPGLVLFCPVFLATKLYSRKKAAEALAGSSVKIQGRDVMATWKLLVSLLLAPILYNFYCILFVFVTREERRWSWIPAWTSRASWWQIFLTGWIFFPLVTYAALRFGEVGMDIFKSLRPLFLCISPSSNYSLQKLKDQRADLAKEVTDIINELGPKLFPDFERTRLVKPDGDPGTPTPGSPTSQSRSRANSEHSAASGIDYDSPPRVTRRDTTNSSRALPRNESYSNIGAVAMFPSGTSEPPSPHRSRSSSSGGGVGMSGFPIKAFTTLDSKEGLAETNRKISDAMRERGELRRRKSENKKPQLSEGDEESDEDDDDDGGGGHHGKDE